MMWILLVYVSVKPKHPNDRSPFSQLCAFRCLDILSWYSRSECIQMWLHHKMFVWNNPKLSTLYIRLSRSLFVSSGRLSRNHFCFPSSRYHFRLWLTVRFLFPGVVYICQNPPFSARKKYTRARIPYGILTYMVLTYLSPYILQVKYHTTTYGCYWDPSCRLVICSLWPPHLQG